MTPLWILNSSGPTLASRPCLGHEERTWIWLEVESPTYNANESSSNWQKAPDEIVDILCFRCGSKSLVCAWILTTRLDMAMHRKKYLRLFDVSQLSLHTAHSAGSILELLACPEWYIVTYHVTPSVDKSGLLVLLPFFTFSRQLPQCTHCFVPYFPISTTRRHMCCSGISGDNATQTVRHTMKALRHVQSFMKENKSRPDNDLNVTMSFIASSASS